MWSIQLKLLLCMLSLATMLSDIKVKDRAIKIKVKVKVKVTMVGKAETVKRRGQFALTVDHRPYSR